MICCCAACLLEAESAYWLSGDAGLDLTESRQKFLGQMILAGDGLVVPSEDEWRGVNLLERDGEL